jgi:hypothetical protein
VGSKRLQQFRIRLQTRFLEQLANGGRKEQLTWVGKAFGDVPAWRGGSMAKEQPSAIRDDHAAGYPFARHYHARRPSMVVPITGFRRRFLSGFR